MQNQKCCGIAGRLFGHKFEPRYHNKETATVPNEKAIEAIKQLTAKCSDECSMSDDAAEITDSGNNDIVRICNNSISTQVYVKDVCIHCGLEVKNDQPSPERRIDPEL